MEMDAHIAQQVIAAFDNVALMTVEQRIAAGQAKYLAWFGTVAKQALYGKWQESVDTILETTISTVTNTDYSACIVPTP